MHRILFIYLSKYRQKILCSNIGLILNSKNDCQVVKLEQSKNKKFHPGMSATRSCYQWETYHCSPQDQYKSHVCFELGGVQKIHLTFKHPRSE